MALNIKCTCGRSLKISSKLADRKLSCPACAKPFRIPATKFRAAEAMARRKAAASARPGPPHPRAPADPDVQPAELDLDVRPADLDSDPGAVGADLGAGSGDLDDALAAPKFNIQVEPTMFQDAIERRKLESRLTPGKVDPIEEAESDDLDLPGAGEYAQSGFLGDLAAEAARAETTAAPPSAVPVAGVQPAAVGYAPDGRVRRPSARGAAADAVQGPRRGFWSDAFTSFIYPFKGGGNAATFLVVSIVALLAIPLSWAPFVGLIGAFIIFGWLCALFLSVIQDTAAGSDDLPGIRMENGPIEDIFKPAIKYIGAYALALAPAVFLTIGLVSSLVPASMGWMLPIWLAVGVFLIPLSLLMFSFDAPGMMLRIDLVFLTVIRTFLPYLAIWLLLLVVELGRAAALSSDLLSRVGVEAYIPRMPGFGMVGQVVLIVLDVYLRIVAMRIVGLYYLHFKHRFAVTME